MLKHLIAIALVAVSSLANPNEFAIRTTKGFVRFSVPDDWRVLSVQTKPPVSVATFQVGNPADEGTPHSTNVAVSLFHIGTERGQAAAAAVGRSYGPVAPVSSTVDSGALHPATHAAGLSLPVDRCQETFRRRNRCFTFCVAQFTQQPK